MRRFVLFALACIAAAACSDFTGVDETQREWTVDDNTMTWGLHEYTIRGSIPALEYNKDGVLLSPVPKAPTGWVTFTSNPEGYNEFSTVYREFLGKSIMGAAAMIPMAMELYGRNRATGEKCLRLLFGTASNAEAIIRELDSKLYRSAYSPQEDLAQQVKKKVSSLQQTTRELMELEMRTCPICGASLQDFRKTGRLGCPNDYLFFDEQLEPLLMGIHGSNEHVGKRPLRFGGTANRTLLIRLRRELDDAVSIEDYELAGKLRDRIRDLET